MINFQLYTRNKRNYDNLLQAYSKRYSDCTVGTPLIMSFLLTNRCNLRCKHCFYHKTLDHPFKSNERELTTDEFEKISKSMDWFLTGIFCGGEPFIRDDYAEIIYIFQKNNKIAVADSATNGQLTDSIISQTEKILQRSKYQNYTLGLSLEGFEEINDEIRGKGTYNRALETWRELKKIQLKYHNFEPYICTTINTINQNTTASFIEWCMKKLIPAKISLIKIRQDPRDGAYLKDISPSNYRDCMLLIDKYIKNGLMGDINKPQTYLLRNCYRHIYNTILTNTRDFYCYAGLHGGFIDFNGNVGVCEILDSIGNIKDYDYDFRKIWESKKASEVKSVVCSDVKCLYCTHESEGLLPSINFEPNIIEINEGDMI